MKDGEYLHRNFDRLRRNRAEMQGINPESPEAYRAVADKYQGHPSLKDKYKKHGSRVTPPAVSTSSCPGTGGTPTCPLPSPPDGAPLRPSPDGS